MKHSPLEKKPKVDVSIPLIKHVNIYINATWHSCILFVLKLKKNAIKTVFHWKDGIIIHLTSPPIMLMIWEENQLSTVFISLFQQIFSSYAVILGRAIYLMCLIVTFFSCLGRHSSETKLNFFPPNNEAVWNYALFNFIIL